jgi:RND family efflux transporter MFP subunit
MPEEVIVREEPRPRGTGWIWALVALLGIGAVGYWAYSVTRPHPIQAAERDIKGLIPLQGEIFVPPTAQANVMAPFRAPVEKVFKSVGDAVQKGDPIAQLSLPTAEAYHEQTKTALQQAETDYANAKRQYDVSVSAVQKQVDAARAAERSSAQPATTTAPDGSVVVTTTPDAGQASQQRIATEQALQQAIADREAALAPYKMQLEQARANNGAARAGEKQGLVRAPLTGTIMALNAKPGQEAGTDNKTPIAYIVDLSAIQMQTALTDEQAAYVKQGMPVVVTVANLGNKQFDGKVTRIVNQTVTKMGGLIKDQQYVALIDFKNTDAQVKPGMKVNVALKTGEAKNAVVVPNEAIDKDSQGRPVVRVLRNGTWTPVVVEVGVSDGTYTQIKSGVQKGETVQVTPSLIKGSAASGR